MIKKIYIFLSFLLLLVPLSAEESLINRPKVPVQIFTEAEFGTVKIFYHTLRIGSEETSSTFNFVTEGGQEILYPFERYTGGMKIDNRHKISFLYQPLELVTEVKFREDVTVDAVTFESGTAMKISYGFPFYRITYGYDFFSEKRIDLGIGAALQMRNASIVFEEIGAPAIADNNDLTVSQNLGPVPAVHLFGRYSFNNGIYVLSDITGLYASSAFINGADFAFEGSILDASLRSGVELKNGIDAFINLRFLGGSASGESNYDAEYWTDSTERATANYLATVSLTLGITVK